MGIYMKNLVAYTIFLFCCGCASHLLRNEVVFEFVNLSTNRIHGEEVKGFPEEVAGGWLIPAKEENHPSGTVVLSEIIHIEKQIKIVWHENKKLHEWELKRDDLGLPSKLTGGRVRFTYLGGEKWRIKLLK